jgi:exosome complex protein LRP1
MNAAGVEESLEQLSERLGELQKNLQPLLTVPLSETTKKLPLLDRAKLYTTIVYAIESLLFCMILVHP